MIVARCKYAFGILLLISKPHYHNQAFEDRSGARYNPTAPL
jgi:hypothetical protein